MRMGFRWLMGSVGMGWLACAMVPGAHAQSATRWLGPSGETHAWNEALQWDPEVPNEGIDAILENGGTAEVGPGITAFARWLYIGGSGYGSVMVSGGSLTARDGVGFGRIEIDGTGADTPGLLRVSSGSVSAANIRVGINGHGTVEQLGGWVGAVGGLLIGQDQASTGAYFLKGGTLVVQTSLARGSGSASFSFTGGTLQPGNEGFVMGSLGGNYLQQATTADSLLDVMRSMTIEHTYLAGDAWGAFGSTVRVASGKTLTMGAGATLDIGNHATLEGHGSVTGGHGVVVSSGGRLSPGSSIGALTVSSLTLENNAVAEFEIAGTTAEGVDSDLVQGSFLFSDDGWTLQVRFTEAMAGAGPGSVVLLRYDTVDLGVEGGMPALEQVGPYTTESLSFQWTGEGESLGTLSFGTVIPEPGMAALLGIAGAGMVVFRKIRRAKGF